MPVQQAPDQQSRLPVSSAHLFDTTHLVITLPESQKGKQQLKEITCHFLSSWRSDCTKSILTWEGKKKRSAEFEATLFYMTIGRC